MDTILQFKGTWRSYQDRVLKHVDKYLEDGKIHIVAAPGSGKTTVGIELIARLNEPSLILAPSIVIRQQWEQRIIDAFLKEGLNPSDYISQDLRNPSRITIATYQALHSAMTKFAGKLEEEAVDSDTDDTTGDASDIQEEVDYSNYDVVDSLKSMGYKVLCLDECHHLRSEWWKALEDFKSAMSDMTTIALTATPPYDSTPAMWDRYINMCGEIDEEITIPELVKEGSLCPHQDYVYFNFPTKEEKEAIYKYYNKAHDIVNELVSDTRFQEAVSLHRFITGLETDDVILEDPAYLSAILIYLKQCNKPFSNRYQKLLGVKNLPSMDNKWMEILLQKLIYDDSDSFGCSKDYIDELAKKLKSEGLIERRKVMLTKSSQVEKTVINSKGKADSIVTIAKSEYQALGENLRMVVLTDYIRKEYLKKLDDNSNDEISMLGVLPFFEKLRREFSKDTNPPKLGVLCGSVVIIPASARDAVMAEATDASRLSFSPVGSLDEKEYLLVDISQDRHSLTSIITSVFSQGCIQILIGTKSLLGEGWDSPCVNSLILASFVGSFMLSNQMRGRAIRVMQDNPNKTSNIWHLVCLKPTNLKNSLIQANNVAVSEDLSMLERRMDHFQGLHYSENTIESGMDRISIIEEPLTESKIKSINSKMLSMSQQRDNLAARWRDALEIVNHPEIVEEDKVPSGLVTQAVFYEALLDLILSIILMGISRVLMVSDNISFPLLAFLLGVFGLVMLLSISPKLLRGISPYKRLKTISKSMLEALIQEGLIEDIRCKIEVEDISSLLHSTYLVGGTTRDKAMFAKCMQEFFGEIDNQRYILVRDYLRDGQNAYYALPEVFGKNKESAERFAKTMKKSLGKYSLHYTRSAEGRALLLKGRAKAFANINERVISHKKVKSGLE